MELAHTAEVVEQSADHAGARPTKQTYEELDYAFDFFNEALFEGRLPKPMITLQRQANTYGYFSAGQFQNQDKVQAHEIALNPSYFGIRPIPETLSVLAREMCSLDQTLNSDKPPRRRYRNREWAAMVKAIGLMPSDTGQPGGKETGDSVDTYIIEGGAFDVACAKLVDESFTLHWIDRYPPRSGVIEAANQPPAEDNPFMAQSAPDGPTTLTGIPAEAHGTVDVLSRDEPKGAIQHAVGLAAVLAPEGLAISPVPASAQPDPKAPPKKQFAPIKIDSLESMGIQVKENAKGGKTKYSCPSPGCAVNVWGKAALRLKCDGTDKKPHESTAMVMQDAADLDDNPPTA